MNNMRKFLLSITIAVSFMTIMSFDKRETLKRYPECYTTSVADMDEVRAYTSIVGYGMTMQGYTNLSYDWDCCGDACWCYNVSVCGTPPEATNVTDGFEKCFTYSIKEIDRAKDECRKLITWNKAFMKGVTIKAGIITATYIIPKNN